MRGSTIIQLSLIIGLFLLNSCKSANIPTQISEDSIQQAAEDRATSKATFAAG